MKNQTDSFSESWFRLDGAVALVTGAGGYLGSAMACGLASLGAAVVLNGRDLESLTKIQSKIRESRGEVMCAAGDISNEICCSQIAGEVSAWKGRLDILVHAAYEARDISFQESTSSDYLRAVALSTGALHSLVKSHLPLLEKSAPWRMGGSSIIAISSMYGLVSPDPAIYDDPADINPAFYGAAKAGLLQLTRWLACNLGSRGIRTNCVTPGAFPQPVVKEQFPDFHEKLCRKNPLGRIGRPDELSGAVCFLAGQASSYINGANLVVDGGWTSW